MALRFILGVIFKSVMNEGVMSEISIFLLQLESFWRFYFIRAHCEIFGTVRNVTIESIFVLNPQTSKFNARFQWTPGIELFI